MKSENSNRTAANQNPSLSNITNLDPMNPDSLYYIEKGLNSSTVLVPQPFKGDNYYTWACSMK